MLYFKIGFKAIGFQVLPLVDSKLLEIHRYVSQTIFLKKFTCERLWNKENFQKMEKQISMFRFEGFRET